MLKNSRKSKGGGAERRYLYLCVQEMHNEGHAITEVCDILDLNRSSYYNWTHRVKSNSEAENEKLLHAIGLIYEEHNGTYGYRKIADEYNVTNEKKYNPKRFFQLVFETFDLAVKKYPDAHSLFHSDCGFHYTSKQFKAKLDKQKMEQSMSRVGRCIDNGPMEGIWGILKYEIVLSPKI